jgi:3-deoxy-D-manno-octulosonate 8-phosphate phosphatase (KDO 8-P phosphatase)
MIADDLPDLPALRLCGYPIAVANAVPEVKAAARYVTAKSGGDGAVREAIEHLLRAAGRWDEVLEHYGAAPARKR